MVAVTTAPKVYGASAGGSGNLTITGLSSGEARPGSHASLGYTLPGGVSAVAVWWGNARWDATYNSDNDPEGTNTSPATYTAGDGGTLYLTIIGDDDNWYYATAPILYAAPVVDTAASLSGTEEVGENLTGTPATFTASGGSVANKWQIADSASGPWSDTGNTTTTSPALVENKFYRFVSTYTNSGGSATSASAATAQIVYASPNVDTPATASGDPVVGEQPTGTFATFTASGGTQTDLWQESANGSDWVNTANSTTTGPVMQLGMYYRTFSQYVSSGGTDTSTSSAIGPVVAPVLTLGGLTTDPQIDPSTDYAQIGNEGSITFTADQGTITAREWGIAQDDSDFGTGANPTSMAAANGGTLWAEATIGGIEYRDTAPIYYPTPTAAGLLINQSFDQGTGTEFYGTASDFTFSGTRSYALATTLTGVSINQTTGQVAFNTNVLAVQEDTTVTVRCRDAANTERFAASSFTFSIVNSNIGLSNPASDLNATPDATMSFDATANADTENLYAEFHSTDTPPGRGNGDIASFDLGALSTGSQTVSPDMRPYYLQQGYLHCSTGAQGASNVITFGPMTPPFSAPAAFGTSQWALSNAAENQKLTVDITGLPNNHGSDIADIEWRINESAPAVSSGVFEAPGQFDITTTDGSTPLTNGVEYDVQIRPVNAQGEGEWSSIKSATPTTGVPGTFTPTGWAASDEGSGGTVRLTLSIIPPANGSPITGIQYTDDGGSTYRSVGGTTAGDYDLSTRSDGSTPFSDDTQYTIALRVVNGIGNGTASASKTVTPTTAGAAAVYEDIATSGSNSALTVQDVDNPAYSSGELVVVGYALDGNYAVQGPIYLYDAGGTTPTQDSEMSGINGETVTRVEQSDDGDQTAVAGGLFSYVATSTEGAGTGLALALAAADQTSHVCATFSNASGIANAVLASGTGVTVTSPATTATNAGGIVCCLIAQDRVAMASVAAGWTIIDQIDVGASAVSLIRRTAVTTASESIPATNHTSLEAEEYIAITFIVEAS